MNRRTDRNGFVRVDIFFRFAAKEGLDLVLNERHARLATNQNHIGNVSDLEARIGERCGARLKRLVNEGFNQGFELGAGELQHQVLRPRGIRRDVRQIDLGLLAA